MKFLILGADHVKMVHYHPFPVTYLECRKLSGTSLFKTYKSLCYYRVFFQKLIFGNFSNVAGLAFFHEHVLVFSNS